MTFYKLEKLIHLTDGYQKTFLIEGFSLLLIHQHGQSHLVNNLCPHQQQPLGSNCLQGTELRCPWHGLRFDLQTGRCLHHAQKQHKLLKYQLAFEGNYIGVYFNNQVNSE